MRKERVCSSNLHKVATTIAVVLMAVPLLNRNLQALLPNPDLDVLTSEAPLHLVFAAGGHPGEIPIVDRADILTRKRPEVEDRHDRYAPIEVSPCSSA